MPYLEQKNNLSDSVIRFLFNLESIDPFNRELKTLIQEFEREPLSAALIATLFNMIQNETLPLPTYDGVIDIGIQGGQASFNELAAQAFVQKKHLENFTIKYLFTSEAVLAALTLGSIDLGLFAVANILGGLVGETMTASTTYDFDMLDMIRLQISHSLMKRKDQDISTIRSIMAHPQVLKQCTTTLATKYSHLQQKSGDGELIDTARAAQALAENDIELTTAILGNKLIAMQYGLEIIEENLQDSKDNFSYFMIASPVAQK